MARILLAEDDDQMRGFLSRGLRRAGHAVDAVADGELALARSDHVDYDLLLADVVMPGKMDGLSLARQLKTLRPQLPILLATGYSDAAVNVRGDFPILRKPYEIHQLSQAIAKLPR